MVKTYDPASYDLAEHFLQDERKETSYAGRCHDLALHIQRGAERAVAAERKRCAKIAEGWLAEFADKKPKHVSAQTWATDAVKDIVDAIRKRQYSR